MRHRILQGLHEDHINLSRIATLIAGELAKIESNGQPDFGLLEDAMAYVTAYPDAYHHPTEDVMFDQLKRVVPEARADIDALSAEHADLINAGRAFLRIVQAVEEEALVTRAELCAKGRDYLDTLTSHMDKEESGLFRLAADCLDSADWDAIDARIHAMADPLFGRAVSADFRRLGRRISAHTPVG